MRFAIRPATIALRRCGQLSHMGIAHHLCAIVCICVREGHRVVCVCVAPPRCAMVCVCVFMLLSVICALCSAVRSVQRALCWAVIVWALSFVVVVDGARVWAWCHAV